MPPTCPACGAELDPTASSCSTCMRARSRQEIMRGLREIKEEEARRKRRPFILSALALVLAAGGYAAYRHKARLETLAAHIRAWAASPPPAAPAAPASSAPGGPTGQTRYSTELPEVYKKKGPGRGAPAEMVWTIRGQVYDLLSLKPVAGAEITFIDKSSGKRRRVRTDAKGGYAAKLPSVEEGGYTVSVRHKAYRENFLDEVDPPYRMQGQERRLEAEDLINSSHLLHVPIMLSGNEDSLEYDLVVVPRR